MVRLSERKGNNKDRKWCGTAWWCWRWHVRQRKPGNALQSLSAVTRFWIWFAVSLCINSLSVSTPSSALLTSTIPISLLIPTTTMTMMIILVSTTTTNPIPTQLNRNLPANYLYEVM